MDKRARQTSAWFALMPGLLLGLVGCAAPAPSAVIEQSQPFDPGVIASLRSRAPVGPEQAFRAETLAQNAAFSAHLLQFRTREERHIHRHHDLTFVVHRGEGRVTVDDIRRIVGPGDVFHIPRNTPHFCENLGSEPLVAVLIFTPPFDMKDTVPLPREGGSYEREAKR